MCGAFLWVALNQSLCYNKCMEIYAAYLAGFFDGEGTITTQISARDVFTLRLGFTQRSLSTLQHVHARVVEYWEIVGIVESRKDGMTRLLYNTSKARAMAQVILPYSFVKKSQLEWLIYTWDNRLIPNTGVQDKTFLQAQFDCRPRTDYD
jgi:hypothetical protein